MKPQVSPYLVSLRVGQALAGADLLPRLVALRDQLAHELAVPWPEPLVIADHQLPPRSYVIQGGHHAQEGQVSPEDPQGDLVLDDVERFWLAHAGDILDPMTTARLFPGAAPETHAVARALLDDGMALVTFPLARVLRDLIRPGADPRELAESVRERLLPLQLDGLRGDGPLLHALVTGEGWEAVLEGQLDFHDHLQLDETLRDTLLRAVGEALAMPWPDDRRIRCILTSERLRRPLRALLATWWPRLAVLARGEVPMNVELLTTALGSSRESTWSHEGSSFEEQRGPFAFLEELEPAMAGNWLLVLEERDAAGVLGLLDPGYADAVLQQLPPATQENLINYLQTEPPLPRSRQIALASELQSIVQSNGAGSASCAPALAAAHMRMAAYKPLILLLEEAMLADDHDLDAGPLSPGALAAWLAEHPTAASGMRAVIAAFHADRAELLRLEDGGDLGTHRCVDLFTSLPALVDWTHDHLELSLELIGVCEAAGQWDEVVLEPSGPEPGSMPFVIELGDGLYRRRELLLEQLGPLGPGIPLTEPAIAYRPELPPHGYRVHVRGREVGQGRAPLGYVFAPGPGEGFPDLHPLDRSYGLWIPLQAWKDLEPEETTQGVESARLFGLHVQAIANTHAERLLTLEAVATFLEANEQRWPKTVEAARMAGMDDLTCFQVLRGLLRAGTPLHDHLGFLEATALALFEAPELAPGERATWLIARVRATLEASQLP